MTRPCIALTLLAFLSCGPGGSSDPQVPPSSASAMDGWIKAGHYKQWKCETAPHDARPQSPHGKNRICSNTALSGSASGELPVDSASVKELFDSAGSSITGHAVTRKVKAGTGGDSWYWYEKLGSSVVVDGTNVGGCAGCHSGAPRDFSFTQVK